MIAELENPSFAAFVDAEELRQRDKRQVTMSGSFSLRTTIPSLPKLASLPNIDVQIQCLPQGEPKLDAATEGMIRSVKEASHVFLCVDNPYSFADLTRVLAVTASASL